MKLTKETLKRIIKEELDKVMNEDLGGRIATRVGAGISTMTDGGGTFQSHKAKNSRMAAANQIGELAKDLQKDAEKLGIDNGLILLGDLFQIYKEFMEAASVSEGLTDRISSRIGGAVGAISGDGYGSSKIKDFQDATSNRIAQLGYALKNDEKKLDLPDDTMGSRRVLTIAAKLKKMATKDL